MYSGKDNPCGLGFPIRKSADQRVLAPPRSLSQRATSFIACVRQGIPQTPLHKRLIAQHSFHAQKKAQSRFDPRAEPILETVFHAIRLSVLQINRLCEPANPAFTMSEILRRHTPTRLRGKLCVIEAVVSVVAFCRLSLAVATAARPLFRWRAGRLAFHRDAMKWWSRSGSNRRPEACKATALPTELRPRNWSIAECCRWWARDELNVRPHAYQACALTT